MNPQQYRTEYLKLKTAIRKHSDQRGDDRCWLDDIELYDALGEESAGVNMTLPPKCEFLKSCERFWEQRQFQKQEPSPDEMTIGQLQNEVKRLRELLSTHEKS